jgi:hypothetical protein
MLLTVHRRPNLYILSCRDSRRRGSGDRYLWYRMQVSLFSEHHSSRIPNPAIPAVRCRKKITPPAENIASPPERRPSSLHRLNG